MFIVIPAYDEAKNIGQVVREIYQIHPQARVVVVDDGSIDETGQLAREAGAAVLRHLINRGQGAALATGTEYALAQGAQIIIHFDADGQFEPMEINQAADLVRSGQAEAALGSRFLQKQSANKIPLTKKYLILPLARFVNFLFTGLWLSDAHNGFRALSRRAAELIQIRQDRMAHNSEIIQQIKKHHLTFQEVPVTVNYHCYGQGFFSGLRVLKDLFFQILKIYD